MECRALIHVETRQLTGIYQAWWVGEVVDGNDANDMSSRLSRTAITDKSDGNSNT